MQFNRTRFGLTIIIISILSMKIRHNFKFTFWLKKACLYGTSEVES